MAASKNENKKLFGRKITLYKELIASKNLKGTNIAADEMKYFNLKIYDYEN